MVLIEWFSNARAEERNVVVPYLEVSLRYFPGCRFPNIGDVLVFRSDDQLVEGRVVEIGEASDWSIRPTRCENGENDYNRVFALRVLIIEVPVDANIRLEIGEKVKVLPLGANDDS